MGRMKRANGEGSVYERNGRWYAVLSLGRDAEGKRKHITEIHADRQDAVKGLAQLRAKHLAGHLIEPSKLSVAAFLTRWLDDAARPGVRATTFRDYQCIVNLHLARHLGSLPLTKLTSMDISRMLGAMAREGVSDRRRNKVLTVLRIALKQAVAWNLLPYNPGYGLKKPRFEQPPVDILKEAEVGQLLEAAESDRLYALYVLALTTGMRQGELFGLFWENIDLDGGKLTITHALHELPGGLTRGQPKSKSSRRLLPLPPVAVEALRAHRARMEAEGTASTWVFCNVEGGPLRKSNFTRRSYHPLLQRAGLRRVKFHSLRHTHATLLFKLNAHPKVVQERLGHSQIGITLDLYTHFIPSLQHEAVASLDGMFRTIEARDCTVTAEAAEREAA